MGALRWTSDPPKAPGWYWSRVQFPDGKRTAVVYVDQDGTIHAGGKEYVACGDMEWAGPLAPPESDT